jgi:outer membrane protein, multidrug efflux system
MCNHRLLLFCAIAAAIGGCTLAPEYNRPAAPVPATLPSGVAYRPATGPVVAVASEILWQDFITDPSLREVIATALANNRDLRVAALNVERAQALYGVQRAELLPTVDARASMSKQRIPGDLNGKGQATTPTQYQAGLAAAWEIDFFGRIRSLSEAALQEFLATQEARRSAQISLVAAVANAYLTLAADRESLQLARTTLEAQQGAYSLVQRRYNQGIATDLDVQRAQQQVESARVDIASYTQVVAQDVNALTLLAGAQVPQELLPVDLGAVMPPQEIAAGVSSEVLLQRPDVLRAEHHLQAANANIGAARAAFFPRIILTGSAGTASSELSGLFKSGSETWSYSPQIVMPIFDPRVWSAAKLSKADQKIALALYERAIQGSFREVADALAVYGTVDQQVAAQEALVRSVAESYRLSAIRYDKGLDSYLSVLDAQRSLYSAQQGLVTLRRAKLADQVTLYSALGGGWQNPDDPGTTPTTLPSR